MTKKVEEYNIFHVYIRSYSVSVLTTPRQVVIQASGNRWKILGKTIFPAWWHFFWISILEVLPELLIDHRFDLFGTLLTSFPQTTNAETILATLHLSFTVTASRSLLLTSTSTPLSLRLYVIKVILLLPNMSILTTEGTAVQWITEKLGASIRKEILW